MPVTSSGKERKTTPLLAFCDRIVPRPKDIVAQPLPQIAELSCLVIVSRVRAERLSDFAGGLETKAELPALEAKAIAWMKREEKN
jgi:hypothetical protein